MPPFSNTQLAGHRCGGDPCDADRCWSLFLTEHPALAIEVVPEDRDIDLVAAGIDVALLVGLLPDSAVTARRIGRCHRHVIDGFGALAGEQ